MDHRTREDARRDVQQAMELTLANNRAVFLKLRDLSKLALSDTQDVHTVTFVAKLMEARVRPARC